MHYKGTIYYTTSKIPTSWFEATDEYDPDEGIMIKKLESPFIIPVKDNVYLGQTAKKLWNAGHDLAITQDSMWTTNAIDDMDWDDMIFPKGFDINKASVKDMLAAVTFKDLMIPVQVYLMPAHLENLGKVELEPSEFQVNIKAVKKGLTNYQEQLAYSDNSDLKRIDTLMKRIKDSNKELKALQAVVNSI